MSKLLKICDGNEAAAYVAYAFSEVAAIYPITPSSPMAEHADDWSAKGKKNIFGQTVRLVEMQSEAGACGACHGALEAGTLATSFTASQGLMLMIPTMHRISGERLPGVLHVASRTVGTHAFSIFGDHSDVMNCRQTGFAMLSSGSVQQAADLAAVAHLSAIRARIPFLHFFDGFRTSHEIQKIDVLSYDEYAKLVDYEALARFRANALNPEDPRMRSLVDNPDIYFQLRESNNTDYANLPDVVEDYMAQISRLTGREYHLFNYYGAPDAERVIVAMGSVSGCAQEVVNYLNAKGEKVGFLQVHLFRPFSRKHLMAAMPKTVKRIAVLDRVKEAGSIGEPLYEDICAAYINEADRPLIFAGRYGLSSKDTTPAQLKAVFDNLLLDQPKNHFTIGIQDDVTHLSLPVGAPLLTEPEGTISCKFWGLGSDGTVGANKNSIKIIGNTTDKYCQAYFAYDSKKSGGVTPSHLRFGDKPILSPYLVTTPNFVACHVAAYLEKYDMLRGIRENGTFLLNCAWKPDEVDLHLPNSVKRTLAEKHIAFYIIDATQIAREIGLGNRTNTIMQSAFFKIAGVIPYDVAVVHMKKAIDKTFGLKGEDVVKKNYAAVDRGSEVRQVEVPAAWAKLEDQPKSFNDLIPAFVQKVAIPMNNLAGDDLPVSTFKDYVDGTIPAGTSQFEKRGIATMVPEWQADKCIQCNQCAYSCPHAAIRPFLLTQKEQAEAPAGLTAIPAIGKAVKDHGFRIQVSVMDCTGCGNCAQVCPAPKAKALLMKPLETQKQQQELFNYCDTKVGYKTLLDKYANVKNSQFARPLFEFSGACAGCGETPYIKAITQLFGDRMIVANATGCSSIYGASSPSSPYRANECGRGVAWANSLFEDNAEFGLGIYTGTQHIRTTLRTTLENAARGNALAENTKKAIAQWLELGEVNKETIRVSAELTDALKNDPAPVAQELLANSSYFSKKSHWIFGGDGWAYDIGYGGLDHVLASGANVKVLVLDTEVYSNTGGQASKATPTAAVAQFAAAGKRVRKKDLGLMATTYGYVYVAQVAMGADQAHYLKVLKEAEEYDGPALIIAYAPCINHGLRSGMGCSQLEEKRAVECGYWHLFRYNPTLEAQGQNPFSLDSKTPDWSKFQDFLNGEVRYTSLVKSFPNEAQDLFQAALQNAQWRYNTYLRKSKENYGELE